MIDRNNLRRWLHDASPENRDRLSEMAGVSFGHLSMIARGHRDGSAELAERVAESSRELRLDNMGETPVLTRADVCPACARCEYFRGEVLQPIDLADEI
jgi:transcriptional regulator with XRE-family HTH domain